MPDPAADLGLALLFRPAHELPTFLGALILVWAFGVGATVGSFLNVVIHRLPRDQKLTDPKRSHCPKCDEQIAWFDNIPIFSWLALRGRCRHCQSSIAGRYPFVEALIGLLLASIAFRFGLGTEGVLLFFFTTVLIAIAYIDLDTFWIPWGTLYALAGVGLAAIALELIVGTRVGAVFDLQEGEGAWALVAPRVYGGVGGFVVLYAFKVLADVYFRARGRIAADEEAMGLGDPLLLGGIGLFLGWMALPMVVFLGSAQGAVAGIAMALTGKLHQGGAPSEEDQDTVPAGAVPFGPFLALGAIEVAFFGPAWLSSIYRSLFGF